MLSDEDKARIEAEERYRQSLRTSDRPVKVTSFTDKLNKVRFYGGLVIAFLFIAVVATCSIADGR
ncbi:hypothetical protein [Zavarzinia compransoris]|uniref:Uncharacterized protein n=1 Tax=Zavarzinia compransoris TaxID=1264899 RepID=A0A317DYS0_9PROT|nr:hypothetical protein [Zavarzinia compransoris]PWR19006.1 hypothetical protein DKG75_18740 [Zavarzinia compransoris]TDP49008.1 hypothetical protein DES42_101369 [Zavarzinia compransoris]